MRIKVWILSLVSTLLGPAGLTLASPGVVDPVHALDEPEEPLGRGSSAPAEAEPIAGSTLSAGAPLGPEFDRALSRFAVRAIRRGTPDAEKEIGRWLDRLPALVRTYTVCEWALSPEEPLRRAVLVSAGCCEHTVGLRTALWHLTRDPSPQIREGAERVLRDLEPT